jgi:hypothetical protein
MAAITGNALREYRNVQYGENPGTDCSQPGYFMGHFM